MNGRSKPRRPSYAGVTATIALVIAVGMGGAYAAGKIGSGDIAKEAVKSKHIKDGQVKTADVAADLRVNAAETADRAESANTAGSATTADSAKTADSATTAESAKTAERTGNVLAASVANGCTTVNGGTGQITVDPAAGECNVSFPRSIANCAVTLGTLLDFPGGGESTYRKLNNTTLQVSRRDSAGGTPTAGAFSVAAICP